MKIVYNFNFMLFNFSLTSYISIKPKCRRQGCNNKYKFENEDDYTTKK